jgi:hypothetical protein
VRGRVPGRPRGASCKAANQVLHQRAARFDGNGTVQAHTNIAELDDAAADGTVALCGTKTLEAWLHNLDARALLVAQAGNDARLTEGGEHRNDALRSLCFAVENGTAHLGFVAGALAAVPELWPRFCAWLRHECGGNKRRTLWVTGHSFGGAVAMVFAAMANGKALALDIKIDVRVVTFGAPRVFDGEAAKGLIDKDVGRSTGSTRRRSSSRSCVTP